jgi:hypothetical protein
MLFNCTQYPALVPPRIPSPGLELRERKYGPASVAWSVVFPGYFDIRCYRQVLTEVAGEGSFPTATGFAADESRAGVVAPGAPWWSRSDRQASGAIADRFGGDAHVVEQREEEVRHRGALGERDVLAGR